MWILKRDGKEKARFETEQEAWAYLHRTHAYSVSHALKHEGYTLIQEKSRVQDAAERT